MAEQLGVQGHYSIEGVSGLVERALAAAGLAEGLIEWRQLSPLDHFHVRGLESTLELANELGAQPTDEVLDIGSGLGGPARLLTGETRCRVIGIDLTAVYVDIANQLTLRCGMEAQVQFVLADALDLPFEAGRFDKAWTQHVAMNIEDKASLYKEVARVLKPGGVFALYDVMQGPVTPIHFPVPWASQPHLSFLAKPDDVVGWLRDAGFEVRTVVDKTQEALDWFKNVASQPPDRMTNPLNFGSILVPQSEFALPNVARNLAENRICLKMILAEKRKVKSA